MGVDYWRKVKETKYNVFTFVTSNNLVLRDIYILYCIMDYCSVRTNSLKLKKEVSDYEHPVLYAWQSVCYERWN